MVEGLRGLVELARIDAEIAARVEQRDALPARRAALVRRRAVTQARVEAARGAIAAIELTQRQQEAQARDQQALLEKLEGQQHQVKSNEAYTALLHEMEAARAAMSEAETAVLEAMESLDEGKAAVAAAESEHASEVAATESEKAALDALESELAEKTVSFESQRSLAASTVPAKMLKLYEQVSRRRSPAIAVVSGETCTGCRVGIPPQNYIEVRSAEALVTCGQCNRILIHQVHLG
jgi:predicted  nucleic acid-binding Zn-ribbon protein